jgi:hypothetical protein
MLYYKDNYNFFLKEYTRQNDIVIDNEYLDYIYFNKKPSKKIEYQLNVEKIFNLLLNLKNYSKIINAEYFNVIEKFLEKYYSIYHHGCMASDAIDMNFKNIFDLIFYNDTNINIDYNSLLQLAFDSKNILLIRELYYLNKYSLKLNIELIKFHPVIVAKNGIVTNNSLFRPENYYSSLQKFISIDENKNETLPDKGFCIIENNSIKTTYPEFYEYLYKENHFDNKYFKFIINPEGFIEFLSSLYEYRESVFPIYSNCICRILEDSILLDYENILQNSKHTYESMYMALKIFSTLEKKDAKNKYKEILERICEEPFIHFYMDIITSDKYSLPILVKLLLYEISIEN